MSLKVEKIKTGAILYLAGGLKRTGSIFLSPFSSTGSGSQRIGELVGEREKVLPFEDSAEGFMLVGKAGISALGVALDSSHYDREFYEATAVSIQIDGGFSMEGNFLVEKGLGFRPSDAINSDEPWFLLESGEMLFLVFKKHLSTLKFSRR